MNRRNFLTSLPLITGVGAVTTTTATPTAAVELSLRDRQIWLDTLLQIVNPVLTTLSENRLKELMPVESSPNPKTDEKLLTSRRLEEPWRVLPPGWNFPRVPKRI